MLGHVALDEERADVGVEAAGDQERGEVERRLAQLVRLLRDGDRVQVDDRVERVRPRAARPTQRRMAPDVVAEVLLARRLDSGEDAHVASDYR